MNSIVRSSRGITLVPNESRLLSERKIFIEGEITDVLACEFIKQVMILTKEDTYSPIHVLVNSPGGEINSGMLMYDVIQASKAPINMYCMGKAYSMAAVLVACGNYGRYILPHGELMIHEPLLGNRVGGSSSTIKSISENLIETKNMINKILAKHTGKTNLEIEKATKYDHYFNAKESVEFGLCDEIIGFDKIMEV